MINLMLYIYKENFTISPRQIVLGRIRREKSHIKCNYYFKLKLQYKDLDIYLLHDVPRFLKIVMNALNHLKTQLLPKDKSVVADGCQKTKA